MFQIVTRIIFRLTLFLYGVNHGLQFPLLHNPFHQVEDKIGKMPPIHPGQTCVLRHGKQPLKAPFHICLIAHPEIAKDIIRQTPDWEIAGIILPVAGNFLIPAFAARHPERLPDRLRIAVPYQLWKSILFNEIHVLIAGNQFRNVSGKVKINGTLLHQLPGQGIEHGHPRKVAVLRNANDLMRQQHDEIGFQFVCAAGLIVLRCFRISVILPVFFMGDLTGSSRVGRS